MKNNIGYWIMARTEKASHQLKKKKREHELQERRKPLQRLFWLLAPQKLLRRIKLHQFVLRQGNERVTWYLISYNQCQCLNCIIVNIVYRIWITHLVYLLYSYMSAFTYHPAKVILRYIKHVRQFIMLLLSWLYCCASFWICRSRNVDLTIKLKSITADQWS